MSGIQDYKITDTTGYKVADTPGDSLNGTVAQNKATFDKLAELVISKLNDALDYLHTQGIDSGVNNSALSAYPVGSIYLSVNSTSPTTLFGGTWVQLKDKFMLTAGDTYVAGTTGGEATHTLSVNEMPSHTHTQNAHTHTQNAHTHVQNKHRHAADTPDVWGVTPRFVVAGDSVGNDTVSNISGTGYSIPHVSDQTPGFGGMKYTDYTTVTNQETTATNQPTTATNQYTGGGQAHNNMPPYLVVYAWKRTA